MTLGFATRQRLLSAGAIIAPMALVMGVRHLADSAGPRAASAISPAPAATSASPDATPTDRAEHLAAIRWIMARGEPRATRSPMPPPRDQHQDEPPDPPPENAEDAPPETAGVPDEVRALTLTTVMSGRSGAVAVINGRLLRENDEAAPGWRVSVIDPRAVLVRLIGPNGLTFELTRAPADR